MASIEATRAYYVFYPTANMAGQQVNCCLSLAPYDKVPQFCMLLCHRFTAKIKRQHVISGKAVKDRRMGASQDRKIAGRDRGEVESPIQGNPLSNSIRLSGH